MEKENSSLPISNTATTSPLHEAVKANNLEQIQGLIREGYSINAIDEKGNHLIHIAAFFGNLTIINYLLGLKCSLEPDNREKQTPLHLASAQGHEDIVSYLISKKVNVDTIDINYKTPLHLAVVNQKLKVVEILLQAYANPLIQDQIGCTPIHLAATYGLKDIIRLFFRQFSHQSKALIILQDNDGKTVLHHAAFNLHTNTMKFLIKQGGNINAITDYGYTPIFFAIRDNNQTMVKLLIKQGALLFIDNINNQTPIEYAKELVKVPELIQKLVKARRKLTKKEPENLKESISQLLLKGDIALEKKKFILARENYYQALTESHISGQLDLTLWAWQKVLKLGLAQQHFTLAAKALMAVEYYLCKSQQQTFPNTKTIQYGRWLMNYQVSIIEQFLKSILKGEKLHTALDQLNSYTTHGQKNNINKTRRQELVSLRTFVKQNLLDSNLDVSELLAKITTKFKMLVREMVIYCQQILGDAPCKFALIGLGSMSRNEMSTYSDLECAILIDENTEPNRNYFRQLTQLLELQIIFLGETPVKGEFLPVKSPINAGFHLDGENGLSPLGIKDLFELIRTPYHLANFHVMRRFNGGERVQSNALKNVCLITGDEDLVKLYRKETDNVLAQKNENNVKLRKHQAIIMMMQDLSHFAPDLSQKKLNERSFNVKTDLYRLPNSVLNNLAVYYQLKSTNSWDRIKELHKQGKLTATACQHWQQAMTDIALLRLSTHLYYGCEKEHIHHQAIISDELAANENNLSKTQQFIFSKFQIEKLFSIYQVILPLYRCMSRFVVSQGFDKSFKKEKLSEDPLTAQGETFMRTLRYKEASEVYQKALAADPNNVEIRLKLAHSYNLLGKHLQHKNLLEETWNIFQGLNNSDPTQGIHILTSLSSAYANLKMVEEQQIHAEKALTLCNQLFGSDHLETAKCKAVLANAYGEMGKVDNQINLLKESLNVYRQKVKTTHSEMAEVLVSLGMAFSAMADYVQAKNFLEQGLTLKEQIYGEKHPAVANTLIDLANVCESQSDTPQRIKFLQQALKIQEIAYGIEHPQVAMTLNDIGDAYGKLMNNPQSIATLQYALNIQEKSSAKMDHRHIAMTLTNLSNVYAKVGDTKALNEVLIKLDTLIDQLCEKNEPPKELPIILIRLSDAYITINNQSKAAECLEKALQVITKTNHKNPKETIALLIKLYILYQQLDDKQKQKPLLKRMLASYKEWYGEHHYKVAKIHIALAKLYKFENKANKQATHSKQALNIFDQSKIAEDEVIIPVLEHLLDAYNTLGDSKAYSKVKTRYSLIETKNSSLNKLDSMNSNKNTINASNQKIPSILKGIGLKSAELLFNKINIDKAAEKDISTQTIDDENSGINDTANSKKNNLHTYFKNSNSTLKNSDKDKKTFSSNSEDSESSRENIFSTANKLNKM